MRKNNYPFRLCLLLFFFLCTASLRAITLKVGETYTCNIGNVSNLRSTYWTNGGGSQYLEFVDIVTPYSTSITVRAKKAFSSPITVQCKYSILERHPVTGNIFSHSLSKSWTFFIEEDEPERVTINQTNLTLDVGESYKLIASVLPNTANQEIEWSCYPSGVVSVNDGYIYANSPGETTITATAVNGVSTKCYVEVYKPVPSSLRFYVWLRDGTIHDYGLEERPVVTLGEELFTLVSSKTTIEYVATDVLRFTLQDAAIDDPVTTIEQSKEDENVSFKGEMFTLQNGVPHSRVCVYDISGRLIDTFEVDEVGKLIFCIETYDTGIYIINTEKTTIKIKKR